MWPSVLKEIVRSVYWQNVYVGKCFKKLKILSLLICRLLHNKRLFTITVDQNCSNHQALKTFDGLGPRICLISFCVLCFTL